MNERSQSSNKFPVLSLLAGAIILAGAAVALVQLNRQPIKQVENEPASPETPELNGEQAAKLIRMAQIANGHLENIELSTADQLYSEIIHQVPNEPLGIRNQAITRYLLYEQQKVDADGVNSALAKLQAIEPNEASTYWLLGKVALKAGAAESETAVKQFERAAKLSPDQAVYWYEAYDAARVVPNGEEQARRCLAEAHRLAPNNLFLLGDWLLAQAQSEDASMAETLAAAKQVFAPLREIVLKRHRVDVHQLLDAASEALAKGDWAVVVRNARICLNVTRPNDFTQGDKRALAPHALEFVVHEFSDAIKSLAPPPAADALITMNFTKRGGEGVRGKIRDALLVDFDLDAKLDLLVLEESKLSVFRQLGPFRWEQLTTMEFEGDYFGLLAADLDRDRDHEVNKSASEATDNESISCFDADTDVVLYGKSGLLVLRNKVREDGTRSLEAVPQEESVAQIKEVNNAILLDFDHDSNLDIFCSTATGLSALLGQGEMAFVDASVYSTFPQLDASTPVNSLVAVDWDRDVDIDIVAIAKDHSFGYLENLRHGNFRWQPFDEAYAPLLGSSSLAVVEADANVSWDLVGTGQSGTSLLLTRTPQSGVVQFQATEEISNVPADRVVLADVDNNGHQDMITWTKDSVSIIRARSDGTFDNPIQLNEVPAEILRCDVGDVDDDGDLDLCVAGTSEAILFANDGGNANNWLSIRAMGQVDNAGKANHHGIGSLIEVKAGQLYQAQVVSRPVTHFGLGKEPNAAIVRFLWTNGVPQDKLEPAANQAMCELMTLKGSCPYVYTWTGERFEFFTDCLWAAPIGLQLAEDVLAPSRSWEYLRIPGDRLRERDGHYELQITEELWEAGYFDLVELIAVDHPTDVEVFSNEKVGPAEISAFKLHTVRERRYPVAATDQKGRDVLSQIRHGDGQFLRAFDKTIVPGLAEEHFLELDLGQLDAPQQITLFLTGWIYPTDTSLNVALSRHPISGGPRPPALHVPDSNGNWQEVQAYMGFPGGKTKTISVDLSDAFLTNDYRLRITTTAEIYWDEAFFTTDEEPVDVRQTSLKLTSADLHYRGFSDSAPRQPNAPETYEYAKVQVDSKWPPMRGSFTRYGNVLELVTEADDRMVILGGGDELTLRFQGPEANLPQGWVRDFIMHNVGWDKDADLNTIYGQSVEPLPYRDMRSYPYGPEDQFPATPAHQSYLERYQTRDQNAQRFWRRIKDYPSSTIGHGSTNKN